MNRTSPSAVHTGDVLRCVASDIRVGVPPSAFITQIDEGAMFPMSVPLRNPPFPRVKAIFFPSGDHAGTKAPPPPPNSWAARTTADVAIWTIKMAPEAQWTLPAATAGTNRTLYLFRGKGADIEGNAMTLNSMAQLRPDSDIVIRNRNEEAEFLLLQGKPIGEPVVQYGPFVMNSRAEIQQAFEDYQRTGFGGWPWPADDPVFPRSQGRYARHANGRIEQID